MRSFIKTLLYIVSCIALSLLLFMVVFGAWYGWKSGAFHNEEDVVVVDAATSVQDARRLIDEFRATGDAHEKAKYYSPEDLPTSLQIPHLRYAYVWRDHVNLVIGRNPDWNIGARIWSVDAKTEHQDKPTAYPGIFFFQYCNDIPVSPTNHP